MSFKPTAQQEAFLGELEFSDDNIALVARAGTGKTTTALLAPPVILRRNPRAEISYFAFGNAISKEINDKLQAKGYDWKQVQATTTHGAGWGLIRFAFRLSNDNINSYKVRDLMRDLIRALEANGSESLREWKELFAPIQRLVEMAKVEGFGYFDDRQIDCVEHWEAIADHYEIDDLESARDLAFAISAAQHVYQLSLDDVSQIDFADMILWPLIKGLRVRFQKDVIFVDEAQDTSRLRQELISKFLKPEGRIVVIGDPDQAIMGFAGASVSAMQDMVDRFSCTTMPLNVTWRCPKNVVALAQEIVPDYVAADEAPEGEVVHMEGIPADLRPGDAVLCRNVAPLIDTAYSLIRHGKGCKVEGRSIGEGLIALAKRWKANSIDRLLHRVDIFQARETEKAKAKGDDLKIESIADKCDTLREICKVCIARKQTRTDDVIAFIESLFSDNTPGSVITLATYHRAKGREWDRVVLYDHARRSPSKYAKRPWQLKQEHNLAYVAITRAKKTLVLSTPKRDEASEDDQMRFFAQEG